MADHEEILRVAELVSNRCRECDASDPCRFCQHVAHCILQMLEATP